jgi:beta-glucanase (GH16 family)
MDMKYAFTVLLLVIAAAGTVSRANTYWTDGTLNHSWTAAGNWSPAGVPGSESTVIIRGGTGVFPKDYPYLSSVTDGIYRLTVGADGSGMACLTLMPGASLSVDYVLRLGHYSSTASNVTGQLVINGGSLTVNPGGWIEVGSKETDGLLFIHAGQVTTPRISIPGSVNSAGTIYLTGGALNIGLNYGLQISNSSSEQGRLDIAGGVLVLEGNNTSSINSYFMQGTITGFGGNSTLHVDYDQTHPGKTTVWANPYDPEQARMPVPMDGKREAALDGLLTWTGGASALAHDIFLGTDPDEVADAVNLQPDLNRDGHVTLADLAEFFPTWMQPEGDLSARSDINHDGITNLDDFALIASHFGQTVSQVYQGRMPTNSYQPQGLKHGTRYYWRVDEVGPAGIVKGEVWSFLSKLHVNDQKPGWTLTFSDEFNGDQMDWSAWSSESGYSSHILSSRWPENCRVEDGSLKLMTKKESRGGAEWTTAHIWTRNFQQTYGYWEARYKIGASTGLNNAFWMIKGFEIDIDEGHYPSEVNTNLHNWEGDHWSSGKSYNTGLALSEGFYTRAVEWTPKELIYYFNGQAIRRIDHTLVPPNPDDPVQVRFSTAVITWAGPITDSLDGTSMDVDYVRVYTPRTYQTDPNLQIAPAAITATASNVTKYGDRKPAYVVNGAGLSGDDHTTEANGAMWMADTVKNWFKLDLGQIYTLDFLKVWNFNMTGYTARGIRQADYFYSDSPTDPGNPIDNPANWTRIGTWQFTEASGRSDYGTNTDYNMPGFVDMMNVSARWIAYDITSNLSDPQYTGLSEIQVYRAPEADRFR